MKEVCQYYDNLTGLFTNQFFRKKVDEALKSNCRFVIALLKIDNIWQVNTLYGFDKGDRVIKEIADRLKEACSRNSILGRIYGTIFGCCFSSRDMKKKIQLISEEISKPIKISGDVFAPDVKVGVALYPEHGNRVEELLRKAELALYMVLCGEAEGNVYIYSEKCERLIRKNVELKVKLEEALDKGEIKVFYQPVVRLFDGKIIGVEALLRWLKNGKVYIPTEEFISVAENYDSLIKRLSYFVLKTAVKDISFSDKNLYLFVNLSARQFKDKNLIEEIERILTAYRFPSSKLILEITERTMMENPEKAKKIIGELKLIGVKLAVDDFGTGFSSLKYLVEFDIDRIKIDKSFIDNLIHDKKSWTVVKSIISLSHNLSALVLAEGVEKEEQVKELKKLGCDEAQGYYFSKPLPYEKLIEFLRKKELS